MWHILKKLPTGKGSKRWEQNYQERHILYSLKIYSTVNPGRHLLILALVCCSMINIQIWDGITGCSRDAIKYCCWINMTNLGQPPTLLNKMSYFKADLKTWIYFDPLPPFLTMSWFLPDSFMAMVPNCYAICHVQTHKIWRGTCTSFEAT